MANQDFSWHLAILHFALMLDNANMLGVLAIARSRQARQLAGRPGGVPFLPENQCGGV